MADKEAKWRAKAEQPGWLHEPFKQTVEIPRYLRRWLVACGRDDPERTVAQILEQALLLHFRAFYSAPKLSGYTRRSFVATLVRGCHVSGNELELANNIKEKRWSGSYRVRSGEADLACVSNGAYAWFFAVDAGRQECFLDWVQAEWSWRIEPRKDVQWPFVRLPKGQWPFDPELTPGHSWGRNRLEYGPEGLEWEEDTGRDFDEPIPF